MDKLQSQGEAPQDLHPALTPYKPFASSAVSRDFWRLEVDGLQLSNQEGGLRLPLNSEA